MKTKVLMVLAVGLLLAADDKEDAARKELEKLQGTWEMAALEVEGQPVPAEKLQGTTLLIKGDRYIVKVKDQTYETIITLDPTKKPKTIDMVFLDGPNKDKVHRGIYELEGDTFKLCRGLGPDRERPTEFATWPDTGVFLVVWKRQAK
ncbi:MAG TPA: TIGR03067 domain-containing protein [Gemmataceae bacterium]|jgi:uncharacterized protein (TIGR03067 family)|nr:TIGR03067 domain-containing protein [Gemmataceae bacterium]